MPRRERILAIAVALVVCGLGATARAQAVPVKVGAALSLSGPAASYGASQRAGIQAAADEVNAGQLPGFSLVVVLDDDASTKEQGINVYQRLINQEKVSVILGPTLSTTATAADPIAQAAKVPVLAMSNTSPKGITDIGEYIWRDSLTEAQVIPGAVKKAQARLGFKTAALLYGNDDVFTKPVYDVMVNALADLGVKVVATQTFTKSDRDYGPQLTALRSASPELLMVSALTDNASAIVVQARSLGLTMPIMGGNGFNSPAFIKNAGPAAEGVLVGTSWDSTSTAPANVKFKEVMARRGFTPDQFTAQSYTAVLIVAEAVRLTGKAGREDIRAGFARVKGLATPLGKFSFTANRDADHEATVQQVKDGKFQILP